MKKTIFLAFVSFSFIPVIPQMAGRASWKEVAEQSSVAIIGQVEKYSTIIRRDKLNKHIAEGKADLLPTEDFLIGYAIDVRIERVIQNDGKLKVGGVVRIFSPGEETESSPGFLVKKNYLILLTPTVSLSKDNVKATILNSNVPPEKEEEVKPADFYNVVRGTNGVQKITDKNQKSVESAIKEIQATFQKIRK